MSLKKFSNDRYLKIAFLIGGIYDIVFGLPMLILPNLVVTILNIAKPEPIIQLQTIGAFLIFVGYLLLMASQDGRRLAFIGVGSAVKRLGYVILVVLAWLTIGIDLGYILVAITDTLIAIIILVPIALTEGISWKNLWQI
ncbi:MAG: hypothetical protein ACFE9L_20220 [Candidatus Hodarchaeota archaeon]